MSSKATQREASELGKYGDQLVDKHDAGPIVINDGTLPAQYYSRKDLEKKYLFKQKYLNELARNNPNVQHFYQPTDDEIQHQITKQREHEHVAFESWLSQVFDPANPMEAQTLYEMYPGFFDKRMDEVDRHLALQRKIAEVKNRGPTTKEDLYFLFQLDNNKIPIPTRPAFETGQNRRAQLNVDKRAYGALNIRRWVYEGKPSYWGDQNGNKSWEAIGQDGRIFNSIPNAAAREARLFGNQQGLRREQRRHNVNFAPPANANVAGVL